VSDELVVNGRRIARANHARFDKPNPYIRAMSTTPNERFEARHRRAIKEAHRSRIDMYAMRVKEAVATLRENFPDALGDTFWPAIKHAYIELLLGHQQPECAETFFNSVACRVLDRTYFHNQYIFWRPSVSTEHIDGEQPTYRSYYPSAEGLKAALKTMVADFKLANPWEDLDRDIEAVIRSLWELLPRPIEAHPDVQLQVLSSLFFRNKAAYLIGVVVNGPETTPFAIPILHNPSHELYLDAVLLRRAELGTLFSLARAYFMVDMEVPSAFISFLKMIFPDKPTAELYISVGLAKQGKTLFYRDLFEHLKHSTDKFVAAPGTKGMVMLVFTLPSFPYVFKIIRDHFEPPKTSDRAHVEAQYRLVKSNDRVGRMVDTLEYSDVAFPLSRFDAALLEELEQKAATMLERHDDKLIIKHLYLERRLTPLDLFLLHADEAGMRQGLREYGHAIRELAGANIFPGDLLLKNFGVTRYGRVVFYDYDEIAPLEQMTFRRMPTPRDDDDEMRGEPWFFVGPNDVFPEEFPKFIFPTDRMRQIFLEEHADIFTPQFWLGLQNRLTGGEVLDVIPYPDSRRFPHPHRESVAVTPEGRSTSF
jgi:isocitrate dehydrogenase kinase/phosphatase